MMPAAAFSKMFTERASLRSPRLWTAVDTEFPREWRAERLRTTKAKTTAAKA